MITIPTWIDPREWWLALVPALITGAYVQQYGVPWEGRAAATPFEIGASLALQLVNATAATVLVALVLARAPRTVQKVARTAFVSVGVLGAAVLPVAAPALAMGVAPLASFALLAFGIFALD